ncbi:alcohol dehydrogenase [Apiospora kogelbergensis]|uniref:Alcohol dehydrogenase n=1 Tax=Apiospora kogelbergensis TaxID=1337665 RepID=A0AAW0Q8H3_9PEZI
MSSSSLPKTYKHAVFKTQGQPLTIEEVELKLPGPGEVLVKVEACGVCYSDMYAQHNGMGGGFPMVPGHEIIGKVAAAGDGVTWKAGERIGAGWHGGHDGELHTPTRTNYQTVLILIPPPPHSGTCNACKKGWLQMCESPVINGENKQGGYSEYVLIRAEAAVRVPAHVDAAKYAPIMCAGMTAFNALRNMGIAAGETVAIQGLGGLGHMAIQYANRFGYRVVAISRDGSKEAFARKLGAHEYVDASKGDVGAQLQKLGGARLVVATAPTADGMGSLMAGLGLLGKLLVLSVPGDITINTGAMLGKGLSVQSWPGGHCRDSEETIAFTELHGVECIVDTYPLDKAQEAYDAMLAGKIRGRAVITP